MTGFRKSIHFYAALVAAAFMALSANCGGGGTAGKIAFRSCKGEQGNQTCDISTIDPDGSGRRVVYSDGYGATWSPDGSRIAFAAREGDEFHIWIAGIESEPLELTKSGDWRALYWSPSGKYLASYSCDGFCTCRFPDVTCKIHAIDAETGESRYLTDGSPIGWSLDSRSVIYARICCSPDPVESRDIYRVDIESKNTTELIAADEDIVDPSFSPDGRKVAYIHQCCGDLLFNQELYSMNSDGSDGKAIAPGIEVHGEPLWSPDGDRIAFTSRDVIYTVNSDGTGLKVIPAGYTVIAGPTSREELGDGRNLDKFRLTGLSWSPNGSKFALTYRDDVWVMNADGSDLIRLTESPERESGVSWGP